MWLRAEQLRPLYANAARGLALPFVPKFYLILGETVMPMITPGGILGPVRMPKR
jgi:hypothetical protein